MEKIIVAIIVNVFFIGMGVLIYSGSVDNILTISFGKNEFEKKKIDFKSFRRTALIIMIIIDIFATLLVFTQI